MNYMKEVAQMLGLRLEEEFYIDTYFGELKCKINNNGLLVFIEEHEVWEMENSTLANILKGKYKIIKKPILDETEKEYLCHIIKPFRDKVKSIIKLDFYYTGKHEFIQIEYGGDLGPIILPEFKKGAMYKGMKAGKDYSLEELGL